jgi:hypothetical protein
MIKDISLGDICSCWANDEFVIVVGMPSLKDLCNICTAYKTHVCPGKTKVLFFAYDEMGIRNVCFEALEKVTL